MTIRRIQTSDEAHCLNDITAEWKIVAKRSAGGWAYNGTLNDSRENMLFRNMAFPAEHDAQAHISVVTGRSATGQEVLYARIFPVELRKPRSDKWP